MITSDVLSWCGATVNIVPQFLPIEAFAISILMRPFGACSNLQDTKLPVYDQQLTEHLANDHLGHLLIIH